MSPAERDLLLFLVMHLRSTLDDWTYQPSRGEVRQRLDEQLQRLRDEDDAKRASSPS